MDKMQLKLNSDKTEYILFGWKQQLNTAADEPFKVDLIELRNKIKYLGGVLDNTLNFESHVSLKVQSQWPVSLKQNQCTSTSPGKPAPQWY